LAKYNREGCAKATKIWETELLLTEALEALNDLKITILKDGNQLGCQQMACFVLCVQQQNSDMPKNIEPVPSGLGRLCSSIVFQKVLSSGQSSRSADLYQAAAALRSFTLCGPVCGSKTQKRTLINADSPHTAVAVCHWGLLVRQTACQAVSVDV
jgi:hypothetical protein